MEEIRTLPQIISAFDQPSLDRARELFAMIDEDLIELSPLEAELAKLFSNSWRYMNFAISKSVLHAGGDLRPRLSAYLRRRDASLSTYESFCQGGFHSETLSVERYLAAIRFSGNHFFLGHAAILVNEGLPNFIVGQLRQQHRLRDKVVSVLGMAFKSESDDKRESLSYKLRKLLMVEAREVLCTDPYVIDDKLMLGAIPVESKGGFELSLEITVKAILAGYTISETPATWRDRTAGTYRFKLWKWLPHYLKWYGIHWPKYFVNTVQTCRR